MDTHFREHSDDGLDQAGLELRNPPASASQVLGLKVTFGSHLFDRLRDQTPSLKVGKLTKCTIPVHTSAMTLKPEFSLL